MSESMLKDIGSYKTELISYFLKSSDICELLLNKKEYTEDEADALVYSNIFPYLYVEGTQTEVKSYLCFEISVPRASTRTIKDMEITIWAYCHKDAMKYAKKGYLGTRSDILADMVESQLRDSDKFGIGKLQLCSVKYIFPNTNFYGKQMIFHIPDYKIKSR